MTTTTKNYAAIAATRCTAELHLVINLNESLLSDHANDVVTLPRDEHMLAHAVLTAARTELAHREELHAEALKINPRGIVTEIAAGPDGIRTRIVEPHLATRKAAVRHLADLIRQHGMDGEDISDMGHDEFNDMTLADRAAYPAVYTFLLAACAKFEVDGYDLLHDAVAVLGW
jgi:hypothetical protein